MADITITRAQYDALLAAASSSNTAEVTRLRGLIDAANGITRYVLQIRWQDAGGTPPPRLQRFSDWPVAQTYKLELDRAITRQDVDDVLAQRATSAVSVLVTPDVNGVVGWAEIEEYAF